LTLRIVLEKPPKGVDFALQKGRGNDYDTVQTQTSVGADLVFEFTVDAKGLNFLGPFVQGPVGQRFVYLGIGTYARQLDSCWSRRLKVPLSGITSAMIDSGRVLEARVAGTAKDGSPACATVKPFGGWKVTRQLQ